MAGIETSTPLAGQLYPSSLLTDDADTLDQIEANANGGMEPYDDTAVEGSEGEAPLEELEEVALTPEEVAEQKASLAAEYANDCTDFAAQVSGYIDNVVDLAIEERDRDGVQERWQKEEDTYRLHNRPANDASGTPVKHGDNSELTTGTSLGLWSENVMTLGPNLCAGLFGNGGIPLFMKPNGRISETDKKTKIVERMLFNQLEKAGWEGAIRESVNARGALHGFFPLRQTWANVMDWRRDKDDNFEEVPVDRGYRICAWPELHVYMSRAHASYKAADQDIVVWEDTCTLNDLLAERKVWASGQKVMMNAAGQIVNQPFVKSRGKYVGLEPLIRAEAEEMQTAVLAGQADRTQEKDSNDPIHNPSVISSGKVYTRRHIQGFFPLGTMMRGGLISQNALDIWDVELKSKTGPITGEAFNRLSDQIYWYATVVQDSTGGEDWHLVQFEKCPYPENVTELVWGHVFDNGNSAYGYSAYKLCQDIWIMADSKMNDVLKISHDNARMAPIFGKSTFENKKEMEKYLNGEIAFAESSEPNNAWGIPQRPHDPMSLDLVNMLIDRGNVRGLTTATQKSGEATTQTDTLGEVQLQEGSVERRTMAILSRLANTQIIIPTAVFALKCMNWFLDEQELAEEAKLAAGEIGLDAEYILPTAQDQSGRMRMLADEFTIRWMPNAATIREQRFQKMVNIATIGATVPGHRTDLLVQDAYDMSDLPGERYMPVQEKPLSPIDVMRGMNDHGNMPDAPPIAEDLDLHLEAYNMQLMMLSQTIEEGLATGQDVRYLQSMATKLDKLIKETQQQLVKKLEVKANMANEAAAQEIQQTEAEGDKNAPSSTSGPPN